MDFSFVILSEAKNLSFLFLVQAEERFLASLRMTKRGRELPWEFLLGL